MPVVKVNASRSNSSPVPAPAKVRYSDVVPAGGPEIVPVTVVNVSHAPVTGTVAEPITVPVGEPVRTCSVPPAPADETRALNEVALFSLYGSNAIQSPLLMSPTVLPPSAAVL